MIDTSNFQITKVQHSRISEFDPSNIVFGKVYSDHMLTANFKDGAWRDEQILPFGNISLSPANTTLHYGQSIFEGMKAYRLQTGEVAMFRPMDNYRRFRLSAERMCLEPVPEELFIGGLEELLRLDQAWVPSEPDTSLYIRPFLFAADEYVGIRPPRDFKFIIITSPAGAYYGRPVNVKIEKHYSRAVEGGTGYAKAAGNYAASLYPAKLAQDDGYDQLIWTDAKNHEYIEESGTMNVMFLINDTLITAPTGDTILNGVTRNSVLELARDWGMNVEERKLRVDEVVEASHQGTLQEAFGTGTAATITSIKTIGHEDEVLHLPESMPVATKLKETLDGIKTGKLEDKFGWMHVV